MGKGDRCELIVSGKAEIAELCDEVLDVLTREQDVVRLYIPVELVRCVYDQQTLHKLGGDAQKDM